MFDLVREVAKMRGTQRTMLEQSLVGEPNRNPEPPSELIH